VPANVGTRAGERSESNQEHDDAHVLEHAFGSISWTWVIFDKGLSPPWWM
jgi:hypothetical protein